MDVTDAVRRRRMVRAFTPEPVAVAVARALVDLARRAPSAGHSQGWAFVALERRRRRPATGTSRCRASGAPTSAGPDSWPRLLWSSAGAAGCVGRALRRSRTRRPRGWATARRRGRCRTGGSTRGWPSSTSCWARSRPDWVPASSACLGHEPAVRESLGVPDDGWRVAGVVTLGHPVPNEPGPIRGLRGRSPLNEVLHQGLGSC